MPDDPNTIAAEETYRQAAALAEHLARLGVEWLPRVSERAGELVHELEFSRPAATSKPDASSAATTTGPRPEASASPANTPPRSEKVKQSGAASEWFALDAAPSDGGVSYPEESLDESARVARLRQLTDQVAGCSRCEVLASCRTQTVFGEGNPNARFVFFGEGPGRDEDLSGRPFVGKAGQLLTKMISACQLAREDVYIMNTVKCRPPNNRNPEPTEIQNCREYFEAQLQVLQPEYIVCLGLVSAQALLNNKLSVGRMRGKLHRYFSSKVLVTYHPSYLLRTPAAKKAAWDDLQRMLRDAGLL